MGIYKLNEFLINKSKNCFKTIALDELRDYRLAVDANGYFKTNVTVIYKSYVQSMIDPSEEIDRNLIVGKLIEQAYNLYRKMSRYGITLVMCWDGVPYPEKQQCNQKRTDQHNKNQEEIAIQMEKYLAIDKLLRTPADVKALKDALYKNSSSLNRDEKTTIMNAIKELGMPCIQAEHDAEKLCSTLAIEGFAIGVYSKDTDNYAFGAPRTYTDFGKLDNLGRQTINFTELEDILSDINLTHSQFVDLCIIAGCDYNERISRVTAKKAHDELKKYGSFLEIEKNRAIPNMSQLNYEKCREIFTYTPSPYSLDSTLISELNFNQELFSQNVNSIFDKYNLPSSLKQDLISSVRLLRSPKNYSKEQPKKSRFELNKRIPGNDLRMIREKLQSIKLANK